MLKLWKEILEKFKDDIPKISFKTWFLSIKPLDIDLSNSVVTLYSPNQFHRKIVENCYLEIVKKIFFSYFGHQFSIKFSSDSAEILCFSKMKSSLLCDNNSSNQMELYKNIAVNSLDFFNYQNDFIENELIIKNENLEEEYFLEDGKKTNIKTKNVILFEDFIKKEIQFKKTNVSNSKKKMKKNENLSFFYDKNINYFNINDKNETFDKNSLKDNESATDSFNSSLTFDNYIIGSCNKFAFSAANTIIQNPGEIFNPLFIYGDSGLGKTHLIHAIKEKFNNNFKDKKVAYIKGDNFTNELVEAIKRNSTIKFHQKYRNSDVLLVDDIQCIGGKEVTQEEFFHTFNCLYERKKQIVLASDRPPKKIKTNERLCSRFEGGLVVNLEFPDFETKMNIIKSKMKNYNLVLTNEICAYIANHIKGNIRKIEGVLKKLSAHKLSLGLTTNTKINIDFVEKKINEIINLQMDKPQIDISFIIEKISKFLNVNPIDIRSEKRSFTISNARKISIYIIRKIFKYSLKEIGKEFNNRDHSTIIYSFKKMEKKIITDSYTKKLVNNIIDNLKFTI